MQKMTSPDKNTIGNVALVSFQKNLPVGYIRRIPISALSQRTIKKINFRCTVLIELGLGNNEWDVALSQREDSGARAAGPGQAPTGQCIHFYENLRTTTRSSSTILHPDIAVKKSFSTFLSGDFYMSEALSQLPLSVWCKARQNFLGVPKAEPCSFVPSRRALRKTS